MALGPERGGSECRWVADVFITASMNLQYRYHPNSVLLNDGGQRFQPAEYVLRVEPRAGLSLAAPWFDLDCDGADRRHAVCEGRTGAVTVWGALGSRGSLLLDLDRRRSARRCLDRRRRGDLGTLGVALHEHALLANLDLDRASPPGGVGLLDLRGLLAHDGDLLLLLVLGAVRAPKRAAVETNSCISNTDSATPRRPGTTSSNVATRCRCGSTVITLSKAAASSRPRWRWLTTSPGTKAMSWRM